MTAHPLTNQQPSGSTRTLLLRIWLHLSRRRRIQLGLLLMVMLLSGGAELVSLGAVLPFLVLLSNPEQLWQMPLVGSLGVQLGFTKASELLLPATLLIVAAAFLAALIRLVNLWLNGRLAAAVGSDLSCEAYKRTLFQPYSVHLQRNSAEVIAGTTAHIASTVLALTALLQLITGAFVSVSILVGLLIINGPIALGLLTLFGCVYGVLAVTVRRQLRRNSLLIAQASRQQIKALQEGLGAIRDVLLGGNQSVYVDTYRKADWPQRRLGAFNKFLSLFPRFLVELLGLVSIISLGCFLVIQKGSGVAVIPLLGALALGAQRILPALQQVYTSWSSLKAYSADMANVVAMLDQPLPLCLKACEPLSFRNKIVLEKVSFRYGSRRPEVLRGVDLEICRGQRIGLIGITGSGKSTITDILMGLLEPTSGRILVDDHDLYEPGYPDRIVSWRAGIAHVPQDIYLADCSFAENIALGIPREMIDFNRVKFAAENAQIADFIESSPGSYNCSLGERGIMLSGGQRQRIGIARALYRQAEVLVLDEATSALDSGTESCVIEAIEGLSRNLTLIMIAHRLGTISRCDRIIELRDGIVSESVSL